MNKTGQLSPSQFNDRITYANGGNKQPSWKDSGYNDFMERPALDNNYQTINGVKERWCEYNPVSWTFTIEKRNSEPVTLTFKKNPKGEISNQAILFEVGYDLWIAGMSEFEKSEILKRCAEKVKSYGISREINGHWLKQSRRNLRDSIDSYKLSNGTSLSSLVKAFDWNRNKRTYSFSFILISPK
jgi:hypothetical protein